MEFGAEWIFYMVGRLDHYLARDREIQPPVLNARMPAQTMKEYLRSGRVFICGEMKDPLMKEEIALLGEEHFIRRLSPRRRWENAAGFWETSANREFLRQSDTPVRFDLNLLRSC
jgi:hypothetical protein